MIAPKAEQFAIYAWIGEDEHGSGEVGIKQGICPAGNIPLVSTSVKKVGQEYLQEQLQQQANMFGKQIRLCKFILAEEVTTINPQR